MTESMNQGLPLAIGILYGRKGLKATNLYPELQNAQKQRMTKLLVEILIKYTEVQGILYQQWPEHLIDSFHCRTVPGFCPTQ